jgi:hypothetical protein
MAQLVFLAGAVVAVILAYRKLVDLATLIDVPLKQLLGLLSTSGGGGGDNERSSNNAALRRTQERHDNLLRKTEALEAMDIASKLSVPQRLAVHASRKMAEGRESELTFGETLALYQNTIALLSLAGGGITAYSLFGSRMAEILAKIFPSVKSLQGDVKTCLQEGFRSDAMPDSGSATLYETPPRSRSTWRLQRPLFSCQRRRRD